MKLSEKKYLLEKYISWVLLYEKKKKKKKKKKKVRAKPSCPSNEKKMRADSKSCYNFVEIFYWVYFRNMLECLNKSPIT